MRMPVAAPRMVKLFVVLAQEILAIVVAIRCPHDRVDMVARGVLVAERDAALMVELDEDDRTVDAVIEHAVVIDAPHPGKGGRGQMLLDFRHADLGMPRTDIADIRRNEPAQQVLLAGGEFVIVEASSREGGDCRETPP